MKMLHLITIELFAILLLIGPANAGQINSLRYSSDPDYSRIVLDLDEPVSLQGVQSEQKDTLTLKLGGCTLNPQMPAFTINSNMIAAIEFELLEPDMMLMHVALKVGASARVFTMGNPDRIVMDLYPSTPQAEPSIVPDPSKAIPLTATADPIEQLIEKHGDNGDKDAEKSVDTDKAPEPTGVVESDQVRPETENVNSSTDKPSTEEPPKEAASPPNPEMLGLTAGEQVQLSEGTWSLSNPWILGQLLLDAFLMGLLVILFRHAQKLNATVTMQRAKLKALTQAPDQVSETQTEQARSAQQPQRIRHSSQEQPQTSVADFESLIRQVEQMGAEIRTASSHERVLDQSAKKKRRPTAATASRSIPKPQNEAAPTPVTSRTQRPAAQAQSKMTETTSEDLSFDEMKAALSRLSSEIETLMESDTTASAERSTPRTRRSRVTQKQPSQPNQEQNVQDKIVKLAREGLEPIDISRELGINLGEVELILSLHAN